MMGLEAIKRLAKVFAPHDIYSQNRYQSRDCPLNVFKRMFPSDAYSTQIETFLECQPKHHTGLGADLPWWGSRYFSDDPGIRTMILSQDSRSPNSGSVCFYMPLMKESAHSSDLIRIIRNHTDWDQFSSFERAKSLFDKCGFDYNFVYVTDAQKIRDGWERLLEEEIQLARPDVILCLGNKGLQYLMQVNNPTVTTIVDRDDGRVTLASRCLPQMERKPVVVASLFPSRGNGHYTESREGRVVSTYRQVIRELQLC